MSSSLSSLRACTAVGRPAVVVRQCPLPSATRLRHPCASTNRRRLHLVNSRHDSRGSLRSLLHAAQAPSQVINSQCEPKPRLHRCRRRGAPLDAGHPTPSARPLRQSAWCEVCGSRQGDRNGDRLGPGGVLVAKDDRKRKRANSRRVGHGHFSTCRREGALGEYAHSELSEQTWPVNAAGSVGGVGRAKCEDRRRSQQTSRLPVTSPRRPSFPPVVAASSSRVASR